MQSEASNPLAVPTSTSPASAAQLEQVVQRLLASDLTQRPRLHVVMCIDVYVPTRNGTVESTRRFAEGLRARGHRVSIISTGEVTEDKVVVPAFHIPYFSHKIINPMQMKIARPAGAAWQTQLASADIVHVQLPFLLGWRAARYAKKHNIACVATHHVQAEWVSNAGITWKPAIKFTYQLFIKTYQLSDCLVCPSQMGLNDLKNYGFEQASMVISNGVPEQFKRTDKARPEKYQQRFVILSVGRLAVEKFHNITLQAVKASRYAGKIQVIIAGAGPQRQKLERLSKQLPLPVEFILVKPEELIDYYSWADLFVHSAETEMEGMACLEAIACGAVPVIAAGALSASSQFALDERSTYAFGDVEELSQKIDAWVEAPEDLAAMRAQYIQHAEQFRFRRSLDRLEALYYYCYDQHQESGPREQHDD